VISRNFLVARSVTPINGMDGAMGRPLGRHALGYRYIGTCIHGLFSGVPPIAWSVTNISLEA